MTWRELADKIINNPSCHKQIVVVRCKYYWKKPLEFIQSNHKFLDPPDGWLTGILNTSSRIDWYLETDG